MKGSSNKAKVLCVDDDALLLRSMSCNLRGEFDAYCATSGDEGLSLLAEHGDFAVVLSDMRMPKMNGDEFLAAVSQQSPDAVRMILTGTLDAERALEALNDGRVFRCLRKPCHPEALRKYLREAAERYRLARLEREVMEKTVQGVITMSTDMLAFSNPAAFGRSARASTNAGQLAREMGEPNVWEIEVAATLSQMICATLPPNIVDVLYSGRTLSPGEQAIADRLPHLTADWIGQVPRFEEVQNIIRMQNHKPSNEDVPTGAKILKIVLDYDAFQIAQRPFDEIASTMLKAEDHYDRQLSKVFLRQKKEELEMSAARSVFVEDLSNQDMLIDDLKDREGRVVVPHGVKLNSWLLTKLKNQRSADSMVNVVGYLPAQRDEHDRDDAKLKAPGLYNERIEGRIRQLLSDEAEVELIGPLRKGLSELRADPDIDSRAVCALVQKDAGICVELIRTANSPCYSPRRKITNVRDAVVVLGVQTSLNLAEALLVQRVFAVNDEGFDALFKDLCKEAWLVAMLCKHLAPRCLKTSGDDEFLIALLHNVGELALLRVAAEEAKGQALCAATLVQLAQLSAKYHEKLGARLLETWSMPATCIRMARNHHFGKGGTRNSADDFTALGHVLNVANHLVSARSVHCQLRSHYGDVPLEESLAALELEEEEILAALQQVETAL